jgi:zinc protease
MKSYPFLDPLFDHKDLIKAQTLFTVDPCDSKALDHLGVRLKKVVKLPWHVESYRFTNGLHLLYHPTPHQAIVSIQSWFAVGSADETLGKTGIAHLFEHLMFKDTLLHKEGDFDRRLEELGGDINACTWLDWTCYEADAPLHAWREVLQFEADRLQYLNLTRTALEAERKVVMNERRETVDDDVSALLDEHLYAHAFPSGHPYAHSCIGAMQDIAELTLVDCQKFYQKYYAVNQCTLVVCGGIERMELLQTIHQHYAHIPPDLTPLEHPKATMHDSKIITADRIITDSDSSLAIHHNNTLSTTHIVHVDTQCLRIHIAWYGFAMIDNNYPALSCLDELLCQGETSLFYKDLVHDKAWVSEIYTALPSTRLASLYEITLHVNRTDIDSMTILNRIDELILTIAKHSVADHDLLKVKRQQQVLHYMQTRTLKQKATHLGLWHSMTEDFTDLFSLADIYHKVSTYDIQSVARILSEPHRKTVVIAPIVIAPSVIAPSVVDTSSI